MFGLFGSGGTRSTSADATKAVLMAPAAVTHANDMSQRHVPLVATLGDAGWQQARQDQASQRPA